MMRYGYPTTRWLVTASLIVSLSLMGLFRPMMAWADGGARILNPRSFAKCCCGTADGFC